MLRSWGSKEIMCPEDRRRLLWPECAGQLERLHLHSEALSHSFLERERFLKQEKKTQLGFS